MDPAGKVVVVTGGASGIGAALAERFAARGVAGVVVADRDERGARAVAQRLARAVAVGGDAAHANGVDAMVGAALGTYGRVDVFCANAGVGVGRDEQSPDEEWDLALAVNVRAHVLAARRLVPLWLASRGGWFVSVASAAGLLTQIGSAPYAVSKHAAVAFAEWLAVAYGDRGIGVSCVCPMAVETPLLRRPEGAGGMPPAATRAATAAGPVLTAAAVAECVVRGVEEERFLILPHAQVAEDMRRRAADPDRWLAGVRRLAARAAVSGGRRRSPRAAATPRPAR